MGPKTRLDRDHGYQLGEKACWTKHTNFELGTRVPLLIRAPFKPASIGRRIDTIVEVVDVYRTLSDLYGTFRLNFHRFDRFELDLRGHTQPSGAALSCLRFKWADMVLI